MIIIKKIFLVCVFTVLSVEIAVFKGYDVLFCGVAGFLGSLIAMLNAAIIKTESAEYVIAPPSPKQEYSNPVDN